MAPIRPLALATVVRRLLADRAGAETITARATSPSGETCVARARTG